MDPEQPTLPTFAQFHKPWGGAYASWPLKSSNRRQCLKIGMLTRPCQLEKDLWAFGKERSDKNEWNLDQQCLLSTFKYEPPCVQGQKQGQGDEWAKAAGGLFARQRQRMAKVKEERWLSYAGSSGMQLYSGQLFVLAISRISRHFQQFASAYSRDQLRNF